ncbi:MAG: DUF933 domain-containing protein [candidate division WOR-3 bacterium]|nr:DUF933 domain-containing protein [candidate division WOR-3 bacterium]
MKVGIIGNHGSGKTTIFKALTGIEEEHRESISVGIIEIPDERLDRLHSLYPEKEKVPSRVDIIDVGIFEPKNETVRNVDAYLLTIGAFYGEEPAGIWKEFKADMIISDQDLVEKRLKRIKKEHRKENEREETLLNKVLTFLKEEDLLINSSLPKDKIIRGYNFFSFKPVFAVINISEDQDEEDFAQYIEEIEVPSLVFKGKLEADFQEIPKEERKEYMDLYGIRESATQRLIKSIYSEMGLITFFTIGEKEVRGWRLKKDSSALEAAGSIHSDMREGFIKAEVVPVEELLDAGGGKKVKEKGLIRLVGKDYKVNDGDVLKIRFA